MRYMGYLTPQVSSQIYFKKENLLKVKNRSNTKMKLEPEIKKNKRNMMISKTLLQGHQGHQYPVVCCFFHIRDFPVCKILTEYHVVN